MESLTPSIIVLASGSGSTFQALAEGLKDTGIEIKALIASRPDIGAIERAKALGISAEVETKDRGAHGLARELKPDLVVLAGYLKKLPEDFVTEFSSRIINVHPSLLPKYGGPGMYGRRVHQAVKAAGDAESGATVHWVTENYDEGPVIKQVKVQLNPADEASDIEFKVRAAEKELLLSAVKELLLPQP